MLGQDRLDLARVIDRLRPRRSGLFARIDRQSRELEPAKNAGSDGKCSEERPDSKVHLAHSRNRRRWVRKESGVTETRLWNRAVPCGSIKPSSGYRNQPA